MERADAIVQTSLNRKSLAKIALFYQQNGVNMRSMSEMLRDIVETYDAIITQQGAEDVNTTEEATYILQNMFKASLNPGERYRKSLMRNMQLDENAEFGPLPKFRGRKKKWDESDDARTRALIAANLKKLGHEPK